MSKKLRVLLASRSKRTLEALPGVIDTDEFDVTTRLISNGHADPLYGINELPDILVFYLSTNGEDELRSLLEWPADQRPATLLIGDADNKDYMRLAMQAGARDFLDRPLDVSELRTALKRIAQESHSGRGNFTSELTAVVGAKGGTGASFLAVNLAHMASVVSKRSTALVDMDLQFGSLAQFLDLNPKHGLIQALESADHLDEVAVDAYMTKHDSGLSVLCPLHEEVVLTSEITAARFTRLLDLLNDTYERVFVDLPRQIDEKVAIVYERADRVLLITQQDLVNVRNTARLKGLLQRELDVPEEKISVIVNRHHKSAAVELTDLCRAIGVEKSELVLIPNAYRSVADSINVGEPILKTHPGSAAAKSLLALENRLSGNDRNRPAGLLSRAISQMIGA